MAASDFVPINVGGPITPDNTNPHQKLFYLFQRKNEPGHKGVDDPVRGEVRSIFLEGGRGNPPHFQLYLFILHSFVAG